MTENQNVHDLLYYAATAMAYDTPVPVMPREMVLYLSGIIHQVYNNPQALEGIEALITAMLDAADAVESDTEALADELDYPDSLSWYVSDEWWYDPSINAVSVNFN